MAIAFDAYSVTTGNATSYTWSHVCSGTNRFLVVNIAMHSASDIVTSVTYNSVALTRQFYALQGSDQVGYVYYLIAPAVGTHDIVVIHSGTPVTGKGAMGGASYTGVDQRVPIGNSNSVTANANSASLVVNTSQPDSFVLGMVSAEEGGGVTPGVNQNQRFQASMGGGGPDQRSTVVGDDEIDDIPNGVTMSYNFSGTIEHIVHAMEIKEPLDDREVIDGYVMRNVTDGVDRPDHEGN